MTPHQAKLLEHIRVSIERDGFSPSFREMREAMGLKSTSLVAALVDALVAQGYLRRLGFGRPRSLVLPGVNLRAVATEDLVAELARRGARV